MEVRIEALLGRDMQEDSPTVMHLTTYLLALDEQYNWQASELRECLHRAEEVDIFIRMLQVQLAEAHANVATVEMLPWQKPSRWTKIDMPKS
jgi:hypothetical protein